MSRRIAEELLRDYLLNGVAKDIFLAEEAEALAREISDHIDAIDEANFTRLFGSLYLILSDRQTLFVARLFENAHPRYPVRSIPTILQLLEQNSDEWSLPQRSSLEQSLADHGAIREDLLKLSNSELTQTAVSAFRNSMPNIKRAGLDPLSRSLDSLRFSRDKIIAHNEVIGASRHPQTTWGDATSLTGYAKRFVQVIAHAYLDISFSGLGGQYSLTRNASRTSLELRRLLRTTNIIASEGPY